jgi:hypothetical protein
VSAFKNHGTPLTYPILINAFFKNATAWLDMVLRGALTRGFNVRLNQG